MDVTVYSTPPCPWCKKAKAFLKENKVSFKSVDVSSNKAGLAEMEKKSGQVGVPVIDIGGKIIVGFDEDKMKKALKL